MTRFSTELFNALPLIGILRGFAHQSLEPIIRACVSGGLANVEITMNSPDAASQIRAAVRSADGKLNIGAGTVLSLEQLTEALGAGASFVVTPTLQRDVIRSCIAKKIPVFPGAFTPTEILEAWEIGATMVKVFPAEVLGPGYIKAVKTPLPHVKLLPTGGVDLNTIESYVAAGADGFGVGSPLFNRDQIESKNWEWLENQCDAFAKAYRRKIPR